MGPIKDDYDEIPLNQPVSSTPKRQEPSVLDHFSKGVLTTTAALSSWGFTYIMNDPNRNPDDPLNAVAYVAVVAATAFIISSLASSLFSQCSNKQNPFHAVIPFTLIMSAVSFGVLIAASMRTAQANKICDDIAELNIEIDNANVYTKIHNQNMIEGCYNQIEGNWNAFTQPNCTTCIMTQETTETLSSAILPFSSAVEQKAIVTIDQILCAPENTPPSFWDGIANYSNTNHTGQWPCGGDYISLENNPQAKAAVSFYLRELHAGLPMKMKAFPLSADCYHFTGFGTQNLTLTRLCSNPSEFFSFPKDLFSCATVSFMNYASSYNKSFNLSVFEENVSCPTIAKKLAETNVGVVECFISGFIGAVSGVTHYVNHCWRKGNQKPQEIKV